MDFPAHRYLGVILYAYEIIENFFRLLFYPVILCVHMFTRAFITWSVILLWEDNTSDIEQFVYQGCLLWVLFKYFQTQINA